jgi:DNA-binding YbaB/EbfC family protein
MEEKEIDDKFYRVVRKKGNHLVQSKKTDGTLSGLQFDDVDNSMSGPIELIEVDEEETRNTLVIQERPTFGQMLLEEVVMPVISEAVQEGLNIGFYYFERWLEEKAIPKTKKKAKEFSENAKIVMSGVRDGLVGKETKAARLKRAAKDWKANSTQIDVTENMSVETTKEERHNSEEYKEVRSVEEVQELINAMRNSAMTLATCIRILSYTAVKDNGENPELRLEMQKELETKTYEEKAGGGAVVAVANGKKQIVELKIKPEVVDPDDVEMLQDLIMTACNAALRRAEEDTASQMGKMTGGLNIPGMF